MRTAAAPRLHGDPQQAAELAAALHVLSERGTIELPVDAWDRSTTSPLPRSVTVPAARKGQRTRPGATFSLVPATGLGVLTTDADPTLLDGMIAINACLAATSGGQAPVVTMRYGSAELFGDEKRLENMMRSNLFGDGRISLAMLACTRIRRHSRRNAWGDELNHGAHTGDHRRGGAVGLAADLELAGFEQRLAAAERIWVQRIFGGMCICYGRCR